MHQMQQRVLFGQERHGMPLVPDRSLLSDGRLEVRRVRCRDLRRSVGILELHELGGRTTARKVKTSCPIIQLTMVDIKH